MGRQRKGRRAVHMTEQGAVFRERCRRKKRVRLVRHRQQHSDLIGGVFGLPVLQIEAAPANLVFGILRMLRHQLFEDFVGIGVAAGFAQRFSLFKGLRRKSERDQEMPKLRPAFVDTTEPIHCVIEPGGDLLLYLIQVVARAASLAPADRWSTGRRGSRGYSPRASVGRFAGTTCDTPGQAML